MQFTLTSDDAYIWWTFDDWERTEQARRDEGQFGSDALQSDLVPSVELGDNEIVFDTPATWTPTRSIQLQGGDGMWTSSDETYSFEAARADTPEATILTGRWSAADYGSGPFILVIPKGRIERLESDGQATATSSGTGRQFGRGHGSAPAGGVRGEEVKPERT